MISDAPWDGFQQVATAEGGWSVLYRDPRDGKLWERTHPQSEMHGGGPAEFEQIAEDEALRKYGRS
ncbi:Imm27 family immunity protein [uncultured Caulobacter sp.]|uniref:Imm27 family immunity protein n=1 Tax=uncultured Caulobacter sp. TaxID=158749 RepID=UPI00344E790C